jgi:DNA-binding transcriptional ArsR family regulator
MVNYHKAPIDPVFAAISDPTRRAIVAHLAQGQARVSELAEPHDMSLPAISKHLAVLASAGLITKHKSGRAVHCRLNAAPLKSAADWLAEYERFWTDNLDALETYIDNDKE